MTDTCSGLHDPYEDQLAAARYRAERDQAREELAKIKADCSWHACEAAGMMGAKEDRRAVAWVREHGGLESVEARLMPEGMEWLVEAWPRYEDGEPVRIGDEFECWCGETHTVGSVTIREGRSTLNESQPHSFVVSDGPFTAHGKRVNRPAPKVLDADGEENRAGDTVWYRGRIDPLEVRGISTTDSGARYINAHNDYEGEVSAPAEYFTYECPDSLSDIANDLAKMAAVWKSWPTLMEAQRAAAQQVGEDMIDKALDSLARRVKALADRGL